MPEHIAKVIRSKRKTIQIEVWEDCSIIVRAPYRASRAEIISYLEEKRPWVERTIVKMRNRTQTRPQRRVISPDEIERLKELAKLRIPRIADEYAQKMGVTYNRITIRNQKGRWGSCSAKGNLSFNCILMLLPEEVVRYVVIHELCHLKQLNHSPAFWAEVEKYCPDFKRIRKILRESNLL